MMLRRRVFVTIHFMHLLINILNEFNYFKLIFSLYLCELNAFN